MIKKLVLILFMYIISISFVWAMGVSPDISYVNFEPFKEGQFTIYISNTHGETIYSSIHLEGELAEYFTISNNGKYILSGENGAFVVSYKFPHSLDTPGLNTIFVKPSSTMSSKGGISAFISIVSKIIVDVPYPERYVEYGFSTSNVNEGENIIFNFDVTNKGEDNIFGFNPQVDIYDAHNLSNLVKHLEGDKSSLVSGKSKSQSIVLNSSEIGIGDYYVDAYVLYDLIESMHKNTTFVVGYEDVDVLSYTETIPAGGIKKLLILLKNKWNHDVEKVYLEAYLSKDGVPITERSVSHTADMGALQEVNVPVYLDLTEIKSGRYELVLDIHYSDFVKQEKLSIYVEEVYEISGGMIIAIIMIILILLDIGWMALQAQRSTSRRRDKSESKLNYLQKKLKK